MNSAMDEVIKAEAAVKEAENALRHAEVWLRRAKARAGIHDNSFRAVQLQRRFHISDRYKILLLQLMTIAKLKQVDMAAELCTSQANISNWINGKYSIPDTFHLAIENLAKKENTSL